MYIAYGSKRLYTVEITMKSAFKHRTKRRRVAGGVFFKQTKRETKLNKAFNIIFRLHACNRKTSRESRPPAPNGRCLEQFVITITVTNF